ncbi:MAG: 2-oxoisovalerate dehydrogenase E1 component alpha subunit [Myxococcota bacterium]|jgi:2-oxoisovalerate dehydrogenase E1 component alpha subunit
MSSALEQADEALARLEPLPCPLPLGRLSGVVEGGFEGMSRRDWVVAGPRERIGAVLRGCPVERLVDPQAGAQPYKLAPVSVAPGNRALHAVGLALGSGGPTLCFLGLASAASGSFHEALNLAALTGAPVIFLVTVVVLGEGAPVGVQLASSPAALAEAFGLAAHRVPATAGAVREAVAAARESGQPTLIEALLEENR